jgi:translation initiation factor 2 alpha subunit (eIF-2alpha)
MDNFTLRWLTSLEDVERLEEPTKEDYRELFKQLLEEFDEIYHNQERNYEQEIKRLKDRLEN